MALERGSMMAARRWATIAVGLLLALFGTVFALQGANVLKGSAVMSGNSTYIYVGAVPVILGLVVVVAGARSKPKHQ
jgi:hypothetical protein